MKNENNPGNNESKVETYEHDSRKGENLKYPNIHNNVYPKNTVSNITVPHVKSSNVTSPNITSQNVAFLENSYPNLNNIHSNGKIKCSTINLYYNKIYYVNINSLK